MSLCYNPTTFYTKKTSLEDLWTIIQQFDEIFTVDKLEFPSPNSYLIDYVIFGEEGKIAFSVEILATEEPDCFCIEV